LPGCQPRAKIKDVGNGQPLRGRERRREGEIAFKTPLAFLHPLPYLSPIKGRGEIKKIFFFISPFSKMRLRGIFNFYYYLPLLRHRHPYCFLLENKYDFNIMNKN